MVPSVLGLPSLVVSLRGGRRFNPQSVPITLMLSLGAPCWGRYRLRLESLVGGGTVVTQSRRTLGSCHCGALLQWKTLTIYYLPLFFLISGIQLRISPFLSRDRTVMGAGTRPGAPGRRVGVYPTQGSLAMRIRLPVPRARTRRRLCWGPQPPTGLGSGVRCF